MMEKNPLRIAASILLICAVFFAGLAMGRSSGAPDQDSAPEQMLKFQGVQGKNKEQYASEASGDRVGWSLTIQNMADVTLEIDGRQTPFGEALTEGKITTGELLYRARMDEEAGYCKITSVSKNGLSAFVFRYPECNLWIRYDVYETPDGQLHVIDEIRLYPKGMGTGAPDNTYRDPETMELLDKEDWGLEFEVVEADASGITLQIIQTGKAQQFGNLTTHSCYILEADLITSKNTVWVDSLIPENETTTVSIDFTDYYEALAPGDYTLRLTISDDTTKMNSDIFKDNRVHPLALDYHVNQDYFIPFTVK